MPLHPLICMHHHVHAAQQTLRVKNLDTGGFMTLEEMEQLAAARSSKGSEPEDAVDVVRS